MKTSSSSVGSSFKSDMAPENSILLHEIVERLNHVIQDFPRQSRIRPHKQRLLHDAIRPLQIPYHPERLWPVLLQLHQHRLPDQVAPEQHPVPDLLFIQMPRELELAERQP